MSKRQKFTVRHRLPNFADLNDQKAGTSSDRMPGAEVVLNPDDDSTKRLHKLGAISVYQARYGEQDGDAPEEKPAGKMNKDDKHAALVRELKTLDMDAANNFENDLPRREVVESLVSFKPTDAAIKAAWTEVMG